MEKGGGGGAVRGAMIRRGAGAKTEEKTGEIHPKKDQRKRLKDQNN